MDKHLAYDTHIGSVCDGSIVTFPNSIYMFMKVCDKNGNGGVVALTNGFYVPTRDLENSKLGVMCRVDYKNLDEMYWSDNEDED
jgi:hypothetical protein